MSGRDEGKCNALICAQTESDEFGTTLLRGELFGGAGRELPLRERSGVACCVVGVLIADAAYRTAGAGAEAGVIPASPAG